MRPTNGNTIVELGNSPTSRESIHDCQVRSDAQWMALFELFSNATSDSASECHLTPQAMQGPPNRGIHHSIGIPIRLHSETMLLTTDPLSVTKDDPPFDSTSRRLPDRGI